MRSYLSNSNKTELTNLTKLSHKSVKFELSIREVKNFTKIKMKICQQKYSFEDNVQITVLHDTN